MRRLEPDSRAGPRRSMAKVAGGTSVSAATTGGSIPMGTMPLSFLCFAPPESDPSRLTTLAIAGANLLTASCKGCEAGGGAPAGTAALTGEGELQKRHGKILQKPASQVNRSKALLTRIKPARGCLSPGALPLPRAVSPGSRCPSASSCSWLRL